MAVNTEQDRYKLHNIQTTTKQQQGNTAILLTFVFLSPSDFMLNVGNSLQDAHGFDARLIQQFNSQKKRGLYNEECDWLTRR